MKLRRTRAYRAALLAPLAPLAVLALLTAGCASTVVDKASGTSVTSGPSGNPSQSPSPSSGPATRIAELGTTGGFIANGQLELRPPHLVVYSDGTAVLDVSKKFTLSAAEVSALQSTLEKDLAGQPPVLSLKHPVPDISSTVLGVRQKDGTYQTVAAAGLREFGSKAEYPAGVLDAFTKLDALVLGAESRKTEPFTSDRVRLVYLCASPSDSGKSWPTGLPQPTHSSEGTGCLESQVIGGDAAKTAQSACQAWSSPATPLVGYQSDKGSRTCQWRPALPDEK